MRLYYFPAVALLALCAALFLASPLTSHTAWAADQAAIARGAYIFTAADCVSCHTDKKNKGVPLAGGRALATPFGTYYSPNITPDLATGIGKWTFDDFRRALRHGRDDDGDFLFPVFPYPSFTGMSDSDIADLYAYLMAQPPVTRPNTPHQVKFPFGWRSLLFGWRLMFFREGPLELVAGQSAEWNRGRYLAEAVVHCEECHTPRNFLGALDHAHAFAGNPHGPDGQKAPNITPDDATGIGKWSIADIETVLLSGQTPDFDSVGSGMGEVVGGTSHLTPDDRHAIAVYLKSLPPLRATGK
ncbi:MAG: cytochrome c [Stellaceae bacterium]|jgi:mono/diheme cytochrome c family protein